MKIREMMFFTGLISLLLWASAPPAQSQTSPLIVINEVAWSGTMASSTDEWIELRNNSSVDINLTGWTLVWGDAENQKVIHFSENVEGSNTQELRSVVVPAERFYLLERTDDETVRDIEADLIFTGSLRNSGEVMELRDADGVVVSTANSLGGEWPAGSADGEIPYASMERINPSLADNAANWASNDGVTTSGRDTEGNLINGTPNAENSRSN